MPFKNRIFLIILVIIVAAVAAVLLAPITISNGVRLWVWWFDDQENSVLKRHRDETKVISRKNGWSVIRRASVSYILITFQRSLFTFLLVFENQTQRLWCVNALFELLLQIFLCLGGQTAFYCFFPSQIRQRRQFALNILAGDAVP